ncbi:MAG: hypothetical protein LBI03_08460 [Clostridiales bacterium]|nr:hypothetical protein [Clostridiales bacterium]
MDSNTIFTIEENGYNKKSVDDYVGFIQTELTKNMKLNRDLEDEKNKTLKDITSLRSENDMLKQKNQKLYRDCVAFAKRLKAIELAQTKEEDKSNTVDEKTANLITDIKASCESLIEENRELKAQILEYQKESELKQTMKQAENGDSFSNDAAYEPNPILNTLDVIEGQTELDQMLAENKVFGEQDENPQEDNIDDAALESSHQNSKSSTKYFSKIGKLAVNITAIFLICVSLIAAIASVTTYIFIRNPNTTLAGYRPYTVRDSSFAPVYTTSDLVIVKMTDKGSITVGDVVLFHPDDANSRSIKKITAAESVDATRLYGANSYNNLNNSQTPEDYLLDTNIIGTVVYKIPYVGLLAHYAFANPYDYIAIITLTLFLGLFIKIVYSLSENRTRKKYTGSDFS